jgi:N-acetylglucosaminyldiphosphoundecaprenol N-acetyl-beta-D-mannosaminyltransferase
MVNDSAERSARVRYDVDGIAFDALDEQQTIDYVVAELAVGHGGFLLTPNVDILRQLRNAELATIAAAADLVVADGMPVVWASRLAGHPLPARVAGSALIFSLSHGAAAASRSIFLLGGIDGVAARAAATLESEGAIVAGHHFPPFGFEKLPSAVEEIVEALRAAAPDIVFVGLGFPKQERLILHLRELFPAVWFVGCGASITFAAREINRAPGLMQRLGLEWVHRLVKEPRRLARRYLVEDLPYTVALLIRSRRSRGVTQ